MILRKHSLPKSQISLFISVFSIHVLQLYSETGIPSDMKIRIFFRLHRYQQRQILVLSESITP